MPYTLIEQLPTFEKKVIGENKISIAELFSDTIQGEGINSGVPSTFMRVQGCTLKCVWCDTLTVWPYGNEYSFEEIFLLFESINLIERFKNNVQHLILTGGSPLKQQKRLVEFINQFINRYNFKPYLEIENEAVLEPLPQMVEYIDCWNNSPKLTNSKMKERARYKPDILKMTANFKNSWFKFVVEKNEDWEEIEKYFLQTNIINKNQIILMPEGQTQIELEKSREIAANMSIEKGVRFTDRLHITIWNKKTGV